MLDRKLIREMVQEPMPEDEWDEKLEAHREFLESPAGQSWGSWQVLDVSGLPLAVWSGGEGEVAGEQLNLKFSNLSGLDLAFAHLSQVALVGVLAENVNFRGATLDGSLLTDSFFDEANFALAKMANTDFSRSSLRGASFKKALLNESDFEGCDLTGADFTGAKLEGAKFKDAILDQVIGYSLPVFDGRDAAAELRAVAREFDGWRMEQRLEELAERHGREVFLQTLVEALRQGELPFGQQMALWQVLAQEDATGFFSADDYLLLIETVAAVAGPKGQIPFKGGGGYSMLWSDNEVPGRNWGFTQMLENKRAAADDAFFATLVERWAELPSPYDQGLLSALVEFGLLGAEALPAELIDEAVTRWLTGDDSQTPSMWPPEVFARAAIDKALDEKVKSVAAQLFETLASHAMVAELVALAQKCPTDSYLFEALDVVRKLGGDDLEGAALAWEDAVRGLSLAAPDDDGQQFGALCVLGMLSACDEAGREPAADLDEQLSRFVATYQPRFFGGGFQAFHDGLRAMLGVLPVERRKGIVLDTGDDFSWQLCPIASTRAVGEKVAQRLAAMTKQRSEAPAWMDQKDFEARLIGGDEGMVGTGCLHAFGPEVIEPFCSVLDGKARAQRLIVVAFLAQIGDMRALPGLLAGLVDKSKKVSERAREGLLALPTGKVLEALPAHLSARKKRERMAAATLLAALPKSKTRSKLAAQRLAQEKVEALRAVLEQVG